MTDHHDEPDRPDAKPADARVSGTEEAIDDPAADTKPADARVSGEGEPRGGEPDGSADRGPETEESAPEDPLAAAERERDEYLDALRRKQAEFENFRKRMMRDGAAQRIAGHAEVAERMLDVLDDFDRTIDGAGEVDPDFLKGVRMVHEKLAGVLRDFGVTRTGEVGAIFDPNRHEAVQQVEADEDVDEPRVAQVLRPGYELGDRVIRAAMVVVEQ